MSEQECGDLQLPSSNESIMLHLCVSKIMIRTHPAAVGRGLEPAPAARVDRGRARGAVEQHFLRGKCSCGVAAGVVEPGEAVDGIAAYCGGVADVETNISADAELGPEGKMQQSLQQRSFTT